MATALRLTESRGGRLTPTRARVLEIIAESHRPIGAYDILQRLSEERGRAAPPTVYRALDFLLAQGLVHRIDSLNAFVACFDAAHAHQAGFFICQSCRSVTEITDAALGKLTDRLARDQGFTPSRTTLEISGLCYACGK